MKTINTILSFFLGADYEVIKYCPNDFAKQKKRLLFAVIAAVLTGFAASKLPSDDTASIIIGVAVLLFYVLYLCRFNSSSFLKFIFGIVIATFIFLGFSSFFGGLDNLNGYSPEPIVMAFIIGFVALIISFLPINFSSGGDGYKQLLEQKNNNIIAAGKLAIDEQADTEMKKIINKEEARVKLQSDINNYISEKILDSQKQVIDKIADKWLQEVQQDISSNINKFFAIDSIQQIKNKKADEEELSNYISELLKNKRKEFAKIMIDKWAEEKKKELTEKSSSFIS